MAVRRVLLLVSAIVLVDVCFYSAISPLLPTYVDDLDLSKTQAGLLTGAYAIGTGLASIPAGFLAARWGARPTLIVGLLLLAVACVSFGLGESFEVLAGARFLQGVGGAGAWAAGLAWLMSVAPPDRRGQLIGTALGAAIAGAIGGPILGAAGEALSPELVFSAVAVVALALAVAVVVTRNEGRVPAGGRLTDALRDRRVLAGAWLTALPALFFGTLTVLTPLRLDDLGAGAAAVAGVFLVAAAVEAIISPLVGRFSDRRGRVLPLRTGLAGIVAAAILLPLPGSAWLVGLCVVAAAAFAGTMWTPAMALLSDGAEQAGLAQGLAFGLVNLAWAGGQVGGSAGGGALAEATRDAVPYAVLGVLAAATLVALRPRALAALRG